MGSIVSPKSNRGSKSIEKRGNSSPTLLYYSRSASLQNLLKYHEKKSYILDVARLIAVKKI